MALRAISFLCALNRRAVDAAFYSHFCAFIFLASCSLPFQQGAIFLFLSARQPVEVKEYLKSMKESEKECRRLRSQLEHMRGEEITLLRSYDYSAVHTRGTSGRHDGGVYNRIEEAVDRQEAFRQEAAAKLLAYHLHLYMFSRLLYEGVCTVAPELSADAPYILEQQCVELRLLESIAEEIGLSYDHTRLLAAKAKKALQVVLYRLSAPEGRLLSPEEFVKLIRKGWSLEEFLRTSEGG